MFEKRKVEVVVMVTFIACLLAVAFYGAKYFAGFQYASQFDKSIISFLQITFILCLVYFIYRLSEWFIKMIGKVFFRNNRR